MYNKNQYRKFNDKKILHKVKKQWVTISLALLMMIGGGAVATHVSANADMTANTKPQVTSNAPQSNSASSITDQAKTLHNNMIRSAGLNQAKPAALGATKIENTPKVIKTAKWDNANVNYYNNDVMELTGNGTINAKDAPTSLPETPSGYVNKDWELKIDRANANINLDNSAKGGEFSNNYNPIWDNFKTMDLSGLHTNNVTNMNSMFESDEFLQNADLSGFNTSNVTNMDYMFSGDIRLSSLNLSNFDTRKASMTKFFNQDNNLMSLTLGNSTKLNSAFDFFPMKSINNSNMSDIGDFYSSDDAGTIPAYQLLNYYPINKDSTLLINNTYGNSASILMNTNGEDVTSGLQNNSLPAGKYYIAKPLSLNLVTQLPKYNSKYSDTVHKGVFYPLTNTYSSENYSINPSSINFNSQINNILAHDKTYYHDYTVTSNNYNATIDPSGLESDSFPAINIKINLNASKYLNDANNHVKSYLNRDTMYQNELNDFAPYDDPETNSDYEQSYNNAVKQLNSDYITTNHNLTEPSDAHTVMSTSSADNWANSTENDMASNLASFATIANSNKASNNKIISYEKPIINNNISDIHRAVQHPYFDMNKLNTSAKATLASADNVANSASDTLKASNWNPTYNNMSEIGDMMKHVGLALNNINKIAESAQSNSATSASSSQSSSVAPNSKASSANSSATSKASSEASSVTPSSTNSNASQSVKPSSNNSAQSSKASSSVAPSSTSSTTSSEASSSANSSVSSQSSNQSSATSQSSSNNSSVSPSSEQQPSDNNTDNTPFIPSFNVPTTPSTPVVPVNPTPVVTPTQNNTASMSDNNNSSVVPSTEPQTTNTTMNPNTNSQVSNSTKPTVNKHHNNHIARNHHAKRESIYLFNTDFKGLSKRNRSVVTIKGLRAYKLTRKGRYIPVKNIKPNTKLAVKHVLKFGKINKLQLTNGLLVTANKHFVSVKKNAKRAIKGISAFRYYRALRKSHFVLRYGRHHATHHIYRTAKKFNKANNAEKKAYRKFARKHTNRNRKAVNKAITKLNNLVNALLK